MRDRNQAHRGRVNANLPETEQSIRAGGEAVATLIEHMVASQLTGIDTAEHQVVAQLDGPWHQRCDTAAAWLTREPIH